MPMGCLDHWPIKTFPGYAWDDRLEEWSLPVAHALELTEAFEVGGIAHDEVAVIAMGWAA